MSQDMKFRIKMLNDTSLISGLSWEPWKYRCKPGKI